MRSTREQTKHISIDGAHRYLTHGEALGWVGWCTPFACLISSGRARNQKCARPSSKHATPLGGRGHSTTTTGSLQYQAYPNVYVDDNDDGDDDPNQAPGTT